MTRYIFILCVFMMSFSVKAHQPDVSSIMLVEQSPNQWVLQIRAALTAFEYEVKVNYGENAYKSPEEFRELVLEIIKKNVSLVVNKQNIHLGKGGVKLGHETSVVFEVLNIPKNIETMFVNNTVFTDIHKNQSALLLIKKDVPKEQFVLNSKNNHSILLEFNGTRFVDSNTSSWSNKMSNTTLGFMLVIGVVLLGVFFWKRKEIIKKS